MTINQYRTGDIAHCIGHGFVAKGISFATNSKITHSAIFVNLDNLIFVVEMQKDGCHILPYENWVKKYGYDFIVTRPNKSISRKLILSLVGLRGYNFSLLALKFPIKLIYHAITGEKYDIKLKKSDKGKMVCSQLVAKLNKWQDSEDYTPEDVFMKCLEEKQQIIKSK